MIDTKLDLVTRDFNTALDEIAFIESNKTHRDIITFTARNVVKKLVNLTPQLTSFVRLSKFIAKKRGYNQTRYGKALREGRGIPSDVRYFEWAKEQQSITKMGWAPSWRKLGNPGLPNVKKRSQQQAGTFVDGRSHRTTPHVSLVNEVSYVEKLDAKKGIVVEALSEQLVFMERFVERSYKKMLGRHNG